MFVQVSAVNAMVVQSESVASAVMIATIYISLLHCTAGLRGLVDDLLSPIISDRHRIWWREKERGKKGGALKYP